MEKKIIFLDFDGVICPYRKKRSSSYWKGPVSLFDEEACRWIQQICEQYDANIVLTTSWRMAYTLPMLKELLAPYGLDSYIIDQTKILGPREDEILQYLRTHPTIKQYVILDDIAMHRLQDHAILTQNCLRKEQLQRIIEILHTETMEK